MIAATNSNPVIGLASKHEHPLAKGLASRFLNWAAEHQIRCFVDEETSSLVGSSELKTATTIERSKLTTNCSIIVVLGGDGTLISVCRHPSPHIPKIIGVNLGTLGFLTEVAVEELLPTIELTVSGAAKTGRRYLLRSEVRRAGATLATYHAINDVVITKEALARIFGIDLQIDGGQAAHLRGDGVIIATPSGSTAYSLAAGGSIVHPGVAAILLTPICPHSLTSRPLVLPSECSIGLRIDTVSSAPHDQVYLTIDGQTGMELLDGDEVVVSTAEYAVDFVKSPTRSYFQVLAAKLKWASR